MQKSSDLKAVIAETKFELACLNKGMIVSSPSSPARYDKIVDNLGALYRVQVKWCDTKSTNSENAFALHLRTYRNGKNTAECYTEDEIDALVVYLPSVNKLYWFPPEVFAGKRTIQLRVEQTKNKQKKNVLEISKYQFE